MASQTIRTAATLELTSPDADLAEDFLAVETAVRKLVEDAIELGGHEQDVVSLAIHQSQRRPGQDRQPLRLVLETRLV